MSISEYSVLMAVLSSDAVILLAYFLRRRFWFARAFGLKALLFLYGGCILRLCAGFEFEATVEIRVPQMNFVGNLLKSTLPLGTYKISVTALLVTLWFTVSAAKIAYTLANYRRDWIKRRGMSPAGLEVEHCLAKVVEKRDAGKICAVVSESIDSPCVFGIRRGMICLPTSDWKLKELEVILKHEYAHFRHHDMLLYLLTELFCGFFWWNPCCYLLKRCQNEILEFRADEVVTAGMKPSDARYYCMTLIKFAGVNRISASCFASSKLERRVVRIVGQPFPNRIKRICTILLFLFAMVMLALSFCVVPQPYYTADIGSLTLDGKCAAPLEFLQDGIGSYIISTKDGDIPFSEKEAIKLQNLFD